ncbi:hypothetical protein HUT19_15235 [Streptomyces sp. NA02950]|uniref:hypothetical protein n=1 Tax=Streptomyces sp. NA02950 TaxID=2742137 RepID=UPI001590C8E3|nr:hypothetical protein [Streptomyces sp. NA02950]QKV92943.1 hypothetical protein HUT19_15235 [Streptomyces sp. NA02950]
MRVRVALSRHLVLNGQDYSEGDEFTVADDAATTWLRTGLVVPADGVWPDGWDSGT